MKLIIAAPANGTELKNALHAQLAADSRISELRDMSTDASYPQISFAVAQAIAAGGAVENYNAQILCMGQNIIAAPAAWALVDIWLNLRHDAHSSYAPKVHEISAFEQQK